MKQTSATNPQVSIVIPAYNGARFLRSAVDSILQQDYPNIELLVFDDGSKDETPQILEQYGEVFFWESHTNIGQAATLNKGWQKANGDILAYLSVDDILLPGAVTQAVEALNRYPSNPVVYGHYDLINTEGKLIKRVLAPDFDYLRLVAQHEVQPGPGAFFRREAFEFTQGWNPHLRQTPDFDFWLKVGLLGNFKHINEVWAQFRVHTDSQSYAEASPEKAEEYIDVIEHFYGRSDLPTEITAIKSRAFATTHAVCARAHIRAGRYREALGHLLRLLNIDKSAIFNLRTWKMVLSGVRYRLSKLGTPY